MGKMPPPRWRLRLCGGRGQAAADVPTSLVEQLAAFEVRAPDPAETAAVVAHVMALAAEKPGAFRERMEAVRRRAAAVGGPLPEPVRPGRTGPAQAPDWAGWLMVIRYAGLPGGTAPVALALTSLGLIAAAAGYVALDGPAATIVFSFVAPVVAALGVAYAFRAAGTGAWEMEMSSPVTPVELTLARLTAVAGYNAAVGLAASLAAWWGRPAGMVMQLVLTWLAPLVLYSALALLVSLRWGAPAAAGLSAAVWGAQVAARAYGVSFTMLRLPGDENWAVAQAASFALAAVLVKVALRWSGRQRDLYGGAAP